jgi:hypothetical protein
MNLTAFAAPSRKQRLSGLSQKVHRPAPMDKSRVTSVTSKKLIIGVAAFLAAGGWIYWRNWMLMPQIAFDAQKWQSLIATESSPNDSLYLAPALRQMMIRDLVVNYLPGLNRTEIEKLLGESSNHAAWKRSPVPADAPDLIGPLKHDALAQDHTGYEYDEHDWDLIYCIGTCQPDWMVPADVDTEYLLIRLDDKDVFASWYVVGDDNRWPRIAGNEGMATYKPAR